MKIALAALAAAAAVAALALPPAAALAAPCGPDRCRMFPVGPAVKSLAAGPDGAIWFEGLGFIGRMTRDGRTTRFPAPTPLFGFASLARGADGAVWFSTGRGSVGRIAPPGGAISYVDTGGGAGPDTLAAGSDGATWFVHGDEVGRIAPDGTVTRRPLGGHSTWPRRPAGANSLALAPDGSLWHAGAGYQVFRIPTDGPPTLHANSYLSPVGDLVAGPDGGMWLTYGSTHNHVGRIGLDRHVTSYPIPLGPGRMASGPSHSLWFSMGRGANTYLVRMTPSGFKTFFSIPSPPRDIVVGPNDAIYLSLGDGIMRFTPFLGAYPIRTRVLRPSRRGVVSPRLFCPKYDLILCAGTISFHHRGRALGSAPFSQRVNDAPASRVVLNARGRRLARARGRVRVTMTLVQHDQGGTFRRTTHAMYLRRRR